MSASLEPADCARDTAPARLTTVLVEDNETIREALIPALGDLASADVVAVAETAGQAVEVLAKLSASWDLAVVDLFLREGSGLEVLHACSDRSAHQRVVVLTNYPTAEMRRRALELGADALFDKSKELDCFFEWCIDPGSRAAPTRGSAFQRSQ